MSKIEYIIEEAKKNPKRIVLPEANDDRVRRAAKEIKKNKIAEIIPIEPLHEDALRSAALMVQRGMADSFVAGASHMTKDVIRAAIQCLGISRSIRVVSGVFLMEIENCTYGADGFFIFADCAVIPLPSANQLVKIAVSSGDLLKRLFNIKPRIAFLTYSSKGSAEGESIGRMREAAVKVKDKRPDFIVDGELQLDAAIIPDIQKRKAPDSSLEGKANVLIFPNLDAANITYKAVERLGRARAIGPVLLGLNKPSSDLSRGCSVDDIVGTVALVSVMAQQAAQEKSPLSTEERVSLKGK